MTDEELIERLRDWPYQGETMANAAADRIETLVKEKEQLGREVNMARYGQPDFAWSIHKEAMADLEAKLAKAVEALDKIAGVNGPYSHPFPEASEGYGAFAIVTSRAILAEIKGESHE